MIMLDLVVKKRFLTKFNEGKQVLLLKSTTQIWILLLPEKEFNEFSGIHLKCNDSVCTTVYSPLSETHYASFPYCKLSTTRKSETETPQSFKGKKTRERTQNAKKRKVLTHLWEGEEDYSAVTPLLLLPPPPPPQTISNRVLRRAALINRMHTRKCMKGRKKKQMTTNEKPRESIQFRQSTCCSVGIFSTTENQRKTKTKRFKKKLKKASRASKTFRLLLRLPAAHSASYLIQNLHKMNFLQST